MLTIDGVKPTSIEYLEKLLSGKVKNHYATLVQYDELFYDYFKIDYVVCRLIRSMTRTYFK